MSISMRNHSSLKIAKCSSDECTHGPYSVFRSESQNFRKRIFCTLYFQSGMKSTTFGMTISKVKFSYLVTRFRMSLLISIQIRNFFFYNKCDNGMREKGLKMEFASKNVHTKQKQFDAMVEFMCLHPDLAKGHLRTPDAKQTSNNLWKRLASELNADGPRMREADAWKKVRADHKAYIKSKLRKNKVSISGTGGGPSKHCSFKPSEELVINLLNIDESISGISSARVFGIHIDNCERAPTEVSEPVSSEDYKRFFKLSKTFYYSQ